MRMTTDSLRDRSCRAAVGVACLAALLVVPSAPALVVNDAGQSDAGRGDVGAPGSVIVRTVHLGVAPDALLLDARAGRVFVQASPAGNTGTTIVNALDARTGALLGVRVFRRPSVVTDLLIDPGSGNLLVMTSVSPLGHGNVAPADRLQVVDGHTLAVRSVRPVRISNIGGADVDSRTEQLYVNDLGKETIDVFDAGTGRLLRSMRVPPATAMGGGFVLDDRSQRLFVGNHVLDTRTGQVVATIPDAAVGLYAVAERANRVISTSTIQGPTPMTSLTLLDATTGRVVHAEQRYGSEQDPLIDQTAGQVVRLTVYRTADGNDTLSLDMIDVRSGRILHDIDLGPDISVAADMAIDERTARAIIVQASGDAAGKAGYRNTRVAVVDRRSGRITSNRQLELGAGPPVITVDEATQRAFVANQGDNTVSVLDASRL